MRHVDDGLIDREDDGLLLVAGVDADGVDDQSDRVVADGRVRVLGDIADGEADALLVEGVVVDHLRWRIAFGVALEGDTDAVVVDGLVEADLDRLQGPDTGVADAVPGRIVAEALAVGLHTVVGTELGEDLYGLRLSGCT